MVQYIDILKSYLNLNKYLAKKRVLWCIYFEETWVLMHCIPVQGITVIIIFLHILKEHMEFSGKPGEIIFFAAFYRFYRRPNMQWRKVFRKKIFFFRFCSTFGGSSVSIEERNHQKHFGQF